MLKIRDYAMLSGGCTMMPSPRQERMGLPKKKAITINSSMPF
jgi:hypothetical protein